MDKDDKEQRISEIATDAFGNEEKAFHWLHEPNIRSGNRPPIELIDTQEGFRAVEVILNQIKYGVFA
jgi:putative toxin-antitoxin system antitoxin component (TIGR02293 family)